MSLRKQSSLKEEKRTPNLELATLPTQSFLRGEDKCLHITINVNITYSCRVFGGSRHTLRNKDISSGTLM